MANIIVNHHLGQNDKENFIRISEIKNWLQSINDKEVYSIDNPIFAIENTMEKVACRGQEPLPYFVNSYKFNDNAGLYFILGYEDDDDAIIMEKIIESLGYSGIGGKKSSGYGKYKFFDDFIELSETDSIYKILPDGRRMVAYGGDFGDRPNLKAFHFKVSDAIVIVFKFLNLFILFRIGQWDTEFSSLRTKETSCGDSYATDHIILRNAVY